MTSDQTQPPAETLAEEFLPNRPGHCSECGYRSHAIGCSHEQAALTRRAGGDAIPAGWQLVPVVPTQEMIDNAFDFETTEERRRGIWSCMRSAAPKPPAGGDAGTEPTYSQISAALAVFFPQSKHDDHTSAMRDMMKNALIAAQNVDRNIFGDCHVGGSVGAVRFMTHTVEEREAIMGWEYSHTGVVPSLRKAVEDMKTSLDEANNQLKAARRWATDEAYMVRAVVQMLGPKARKVWKLWKDKGVQRVHTSWGPEAPMDDGEAIAQLHLDMEEAIKTAVPIDNIDEHIGTLNFKE